MMLDAFPEPGVPFKQWKPGDMPNYLIYDTSLKAPTGFAIRVGKNMKLYVGLARDRKGNEQVIDLDTARDLAREQATIAKKHGANPKNIAETIEAAELSLGQVWNRYTKDLTGRCKPIKPNSLESLVKARAKLKDWEDRKVRLITAQEILDRFDFHAVDRGHRTAAEAWAGGPRLRWATPMKTRSTTPIRRAERLHSLLTRSPSSKIKEKYRDRTQLERC